MSHALNLYLNVLYICQLLPNMAKVRTFCENIDDRFGIKFQA